MKPAAFDYHRARSVEDALDHLGNGDEAKIVAGAQSLGPMLNLRLARPRRLVDVSALEALWAREAKPDHVAIGAAVTHAEIEDGRAPEPFAGAMREVAAGIAYRAVRNRGTIGGSVAHADPAADWLSFLLCADARLGVRAASGERMVPIAGFVRAAYTTALGPAEIVTRIEIPRRGRVARFGYYKLCRKAGELAEAIGVVLVDPERRYCRVVAGAIGTRPVALAATARALAAHARAPTALAIRADVSASTGETDRVKLHMAALAVGRAIERALGRR